MSAPGQVRTGGSGTAVDGNRYDSETESERHEEFDKIQLLERLPNRTKAVGYLLQLIPVVSGGNVGGMDAAAEPTGTYSRRFAEEMIGITRPTGSLRS